MGRHGLTIVDMYRKLCISYFSRKGKSVYHFIDIIENFIYQGVIVCYRTTSQNPGGLCYSLFKLGQNVMSLLKQNIQFPPPLSTD